MDDTPRPTATNPDTNYSLTIEQAATCYSQAGHPRTLRTVQRYCASGHLDCVKEATTLGDKYFVNPASVTRHIAQIEELTALDARTAGRDWSRPAASSDAQQTTHDEPRQEQATPDQKSPPVASAAPKNPPVPGPTSNDTARPAPTTPDTPSRQVATADTETPRYVAQLEKRIQEKDETIRFLQDELTDRRSQIKELSTRYGEMHILVQGLQRMLAPLLGPSHNDPHKEGEQPLH